MNAVPRSNVTYSYVPARRYCFSSMYPENGAAIDSATVGRPEVVLAYLNSFVLTINLSYYCPCRGFVLAYMAIEKRLPR